MSYCTILITKKSETEKVQEELKKFDTCNRENPFCKEIVTKWYSKEDFINIPKLYNNFENFDIILLENYYSNFHEFLPDYEQKIKQFQKKGWSDEQIQKWQEEQKRKNENGASIVTIRKQQKEEFLFSLAQKYFVSFAYYMQGKEWNDFKESKKITKQLEEYEENVVYVIDEKMYMKVLNAISYSL